MAVRTGGGFHVPFQKGFSMNRPAIGVYRVYHREPERGHTLGIRMATGTGIYNISAIYGGFRIPGAGDGMSAAVAVQAGSRIGAALFRGQTVHGIQVRIRLFGVTKPAGNRVQIIGMRHRIGIPVAGRAANLFVNGIPCCCSIHKGNTAPLPAVAHHACVIRDGLCPQARGKKDSDQDTEDPCRLEGFEWGHYDDSLHP